MSASLINKRRRRIIFAVTGSVAAVKGPEIAVRLVQESDFDVHILLTRGGENFWRKAEDYDPKYWNLLQELFLNSNNEEICKRNHAISFPSGKRISISYADDEWKDWKRLGDPVLHIDLRDWADLLLVAPLSAHTLAKIANGLCDDTLSCVLRAWDYGRGSRPGKPLLIAPAMNTAMWEHPITQSQLKTIQGFSKSSRQLHSPSSLNRVLPTPPSSAVAAAAASTGISETHDDDHDESESNLVRIISPQVKTLACGEVGNGALSTVTEILQACVHYRNKEKEDSGGK